MSALTWNLLGELNYWAVLVAGLITFFLGGLWYSPALFEGAWMNAQGYSQGDVDQMMGQLVPVGFLVSFVSYLMMAMVLALLIAALNVNTLAAGALAGVLVWIGFLAPAGLAVNLFSLRPVAAWLIDAGYQLTFLALTGAILGAWK